MSWLRRAEPSRQPISITLVVVGGRETEKNYFASLKQEWKTNTFEVKSSGHQADAKEVLELAKRLRSESGIEYDSVWIVFDVETEHNTNAIRETLQTAATAQINCAPSNPCMEYWFLLHFKHDGSPAHHCNEVKRRLEKAWPDYEKNTRNFANIIPHLNNAIRNASNVFKHARREATADVTIGLNPSTMIGELVSLLRPTGQP